MYALFNFDQNSTLHALFWGAHIFDLQTTELGIIEPKYLTKRIIDLKVRLTSRITDPQNHENFLKKLVFYLKMILYLQHSQ